MNFTGPLTATYNGSGYAFNDNVNFTIPASSMIPQIVSVGGASFSVQLVSFTNPGIPNGQTPEGNIGGRITAVPEPGSVAMLAVMGLSGAGLLARRRKQAA